MKNFYIQFAMQLENIKISKIVIVIDNLLLYYSILLLIIFNNILEQL